MKIMGPSILLSLDSPSATRGRIFSYTVEGRGAELFVVIIITFRRAYVSNETQRTVGQKSGATRKGKRRKEDAQRDEGEQMNEGLE